MWEQSGDLSDALHLMYAAGGDVLYSYLRLPSDASAANLMNPKRRRHPLATSFRTLDARSYSEIATINVERTVADLAVDPTDCYLGIVAWDPNPGTRAEVESSLRVYEVGRARPSADDDSDDDAHEGDGEDESEEASEEEVSGFASSPSAFAAFAGFAAAAAAPAPVQEEYCTCKAGIFV